MSLVTWTVSTVTDGAASSVTPNATESAGALVLFSWETAAPTVPPVSVSTTRARTLALTTSSCKVHAGGKHPKKSRKLAAKAALSKLATSPLRTKPTATRVASTMAVVEPGDMGGGGDSGGGDSGGGGAGYTGRVSGTGVANLNELAVLPL